MPRHDLEDLRCRGALAKTMRVRVGCEFRYETQAPVPMLMLVRARPDAEHRDPSMSPSWTEPSLDVREYRDGFGNPCWRLVLPTGQSVVRYDAIVEVSGDAGRGGARCAAGARRGPAGRHAGVHAPEPLHRVGPAAGRCLAAVRRHAADLGAGPGRLRLGARERRVRLRAERAVHHGAGRVQAASGCLPRLRADQRGVLPGAEHPGPLHLRLPAATSPSSRRTCRWTSTPGSRRTWAAGGTRSTRATTCRGSGGSRSRTAATPWTWRSRRPTAPPTLTSMVVWADEIAERRAPRLRPDREQRPDPESSARRTLTRGARTER